MANAFHTAQQDKVIPLGLLKLRERSNPKFVVTMEMLQEYHRNDEEVQ
jgi:hypothetical protein